jgi:hypothetical protein
MYTGTLIRDLMATVERSVERNNNEQRIAEELHAIFAMQIPVVDNDHLLLRAA